MTPRHRHAAAGAVGPALDARGDDHASRPTRSDRVFVLGARGLGGLDAGRDGADRRCSSSSARWPALEQQGWSFLTEYAVAARGRTFGIAVAAVGHHPHRALRAGRRGAGRLRCRPVHQRVRAALARRPLITLVDLMAAVPSIIYAMWALFFLQAHLLTVAAVALGPPRRAAAVPARRRAGLAVVVHLVGVHRRASPSAWSCCRRSPRSCARCSRRRRSVSARAPSPSVPPGGG